MKIVAVISGYTHVAGSVHRATEMAAAARTRGLRVSVVDFNVRSMPLDLFYSAINDGPDYASPDRARLSDKLQALRDDKFDLAIIDTPVGDRSAQAAAMHAADVCFFLDGAVDDPKSAVDLGLAALDVLL